jgi:hypothetical protein
MVVVVVTIEPNFIGWRRAGGSAFEYTIVASYISQPAISHSREAINDGAGEPIVDIVCFVVIGVAGKYCKKEPHFSSGLSLSFIQQGRG